MALWTIKNLESKSWFFFDEYGEKLKEMLFLVHKNWERKSVNRFLGAIRDSNWLFMVVGILMAMAMLWLLEEDEGDRVKYAFSKKKVMAFSWIIWTLGMKETSQSSKKTWLSFVFEFKFWVIFAKNPLISLFFFWENNLTI